VRESEPAGVKSALQGLFSTLINASAESVKAHLTQLVTRIESTNRMLRSPVDELALRLYEQYAGDVGVFCVYLLNYRCLQPGEALYLGANEPHAYIYGDCAEVMATSDNVVRAGLTPKWKDVHTLCSCLTYYDGAPHVVEPTQTDPNEPHVWRYQTPADEFVLDRVQMQEGQRARLSSCRGLAILIVVSGSISVEQIADTRGDYTPTEAGNFRSFLSAGAVHLVCPNTALEMSAQHGELLAFRATAPEVVGSPDPLGALSQRSDLSLP